MFNRFLYERSLHPKEQKQQKQPSLRRSKERDLYCQHYKERVRNFLVSMANQPCVMGQYIPPVKEIVRERDESKVLASATLSINGFKTDSQRLERAMLDNNLLDTTPANGMNHRYRSREKEKEIQGGMRFEGSLLARISEGRSNKSQRTESSQRTALPPINPQLKLHSKLHFKGVEELGNKLRSMRQTESERISLLNRLQTIYQGKTINIQDTSLSVLQACRLSKAKTVHHLKPIL